MKREIKFKAFSQESKKTMTWDDIKKFGNLSKLISLNHIELSQYTGLKDKKGKEIYEGDVVKPNPKYITSNCIVVLDGIELKLKTKYWCNFFAKYVWNGCEIVGNIFDNPKLI